MNYGVKWSWILVLKLHSSYSPALYLSPLSLWESRFVLSLETTFYLQIRSEGSANYQRGQLWYESFSFLSAQKFRVLFLSVGCRLDTDGPGKNLCWFPYSDMHSLGQTWWTKPSLYRFSLLAWYWRLIMWSSYFSTFLSKWLSEGDLIFDRGC